MIQGKTERYHRSIKNVVKQEQYYYSWELEKANGEWVHHCNHERYHESLENMAPVEYLMAKITRKNSRNLWPSRGTYTRDGGRTPKK